MHEEGERRSEGARGGAPRPGSPGRYDRIRHVRHERASFDPRFFERHRDYWPIARAAAVFADREEWPDVVEYATAFEGEPPVRFELAPPRRRRPAGEPVIRENLYDAVIVRRRLVPTRARMWHDYLNALVWTTFPRAKLALHERQHAAIERWVPEGATQLPNARTRELDALALVDEGGVLELDDGERKTTVLFGHALFEGLVLGRPAMIARAVPLSVPAAARSPEHATDEERARATVRLADALLADVLRDPARVVSPDELPRLPL